MLCGDWFSSKKPFTNSSQNCYLFRVMQSDFFGAWYVVDMVDFPKSNSVLAKENSLECQFELAHSFVFTTQTTFHYPCWRSLAAQRLLVIWIFRYIFPTNRSPQAWTPWKFWIFWNASKCRRIKGISSVVFA